MHRVWRVRLSSYVRSYSPCWLTAWSDVDACILSPDKGIEIHAAWLNEDKSLLKIYTGGFELRLTISSAFSFINVSHIQSKHTGVDFWSLLMAAVENILPFRKWEFTHWATLVAVGWNFLDLSHRFPEFRITWNQQMITFEFGKMAVSPLALDVPKLGFPIIILPQVYYILMLYSSHVLILYSSTFFVMKYAILKVLNDAAY